MKKALGDGKMATKMLTKMAEQNPDLKDAYLAKIDKVTTKHMAKTLEEYAADSDAVIAKLDQRL